MSGDLAVPPTACHMLSYADGKLIASFLDRADAEFARQLWEEFGGHTGMLITEVIVDGDATLVIGDHS